MPDGWVDRHDIIAKLDETLGKPVFARRSEWGRGSRAKAGQRAMIAQAGGPAPLRPPDAKRPDAWKAREVGGTP